MFPHLPTTNHWRASKRLEFVKIARGNTQTLPLLLPFTCKKKKSLPMKWLCSRGNQQSKPYITNSCYMLKVSSLITLAKLPIHTRYTMHHFQGRQTYASALSCVLIRCLFSMSDVYPLMLSVLGERSNEFGQAHSTQSRKLSVYPEWQYLKSRKKDMLYKQPSFFKILLFLL